MYRTLTRRQASIIGALGRGMIPCGGDFFELGAASIEERWLPRADYYISRMPLLTRLGIKLMLYALDCAGPFVFARRVALLSRMDEDGLVSLLHRLEHAGPLGDGIMVVVKSLVFPAFYGTEEAKKAIGYVEKFPVPEDFEGVKP